MIFFFVVKAAVDVKDVLSFLFDIVDTCYRRVIVRILFLFATVLRIF